MQIKRVFYSVCVSKFTLSLFLTNYAAFHKSNLNCLLLYCSKTHNDSRKENVAMFYNLTEKSLKQLSKNKKYDGKKTICNHKIGAVYEVKIQYLAQWKWFTIDTLHYPGLFSIGKWSNDSNACFIFNWTLLKAVEKSRLDFVKLHLIWRSVTQNSNVSTLDDTKVCLCAKICRFITDCRICDLI